ncbi:GroES-like protein [Trichodelitschia bisporula]|uniref:GroES-like protein n=1 Tax=Trichodelitschia bisporula TaxID=703511 RepID=A0A6G1HQD9_9PEZI|nr:GroES-like protein [Trichodelitschia bisporula]
MHLLSAPAAPHSSPSLWPPTPKRAYRAISPAAEQGAKRRRTLESESERSEPRAEDVKPRPGPSPAPAGAEATNGTTATASTKHHIPERQKALLLHAPKSRYVLEDGFAVPKIKDDNELLVRVEYIGLNPIDWKAPDFNFGIPSLPYLAGRDIVGTVVRAPTSDSRVKVGDVVLTASTDYRDPRKAAYQHYAIASSFNVARLPSSPSPATAGLGVAFVAAALALGVCLGCDFSGTGAKGAPGPNLPTVLRALDPEVIPADVRAECLSGRTDAERPKKGDWLAIWGGSSASAKMLAQLARLLGLRVIKVVDVGKHGAALSWTKHADLLVDSHDPARAVAIIRRVTGEELRFGVDTAGKETAGWLGKCLGEGGHLVGLAGLPMKEEGGVRQHVVPIKVHHECREVGEGLMVWLEGLLRGGLVTPPEAEVVHEGLGGVNGALDRMRRGEVSGRRLVVKVE